MMTSSFPRISLKKHESKRISDGHLWIYANEIDNVKTPLKSIQQALVHVYDDKENFIATASFNAHALIAARILSYQPLTQLDATFFEQKIGQALLLRQHTFQAPYYRLIYSDGDNLPGLIIDRFDQRFVLQTSSLAMEQAIETITACLQHCFGTHISIFIKNDGKGRQLEQLECYQRYVGTPFEHMTLIENDVTFTIPAQGQKTGWFYDHRLGRAFLNSVCLNKTVLDLFCYMGGWGLQAAHHGAAQVDCVDSSSLALRYVQQNATQLAVAHKVNHIEADIFEFIKTKVTQSYDIVVLDPPALIQKRKDMDNGKQAYFRLNEGAMRRVAEGGMLVSGSCSAHLKREDLLLIVQKVAKRLNKQATLVHETHAGSDHPMNVSMPETAYLKCLFFRISSKD